MGKATKQDVFVIFFLFTISVVTQIIFLIPPILSDPLEYYQTAALFPHLPGQPSHWSLRIGLILPVAFLYRLFGHAELTYYMVPITSTAILTIGIYLLGRKIFNNRVGFVSALWFMFMPGILLESGQLLPDFPATACVVFGIVLLIPGKNDRKRKWVTLIAGTLFGWAYLTKEYFLIFLLLVPLIFWIYKVPIKNLFPFLVGFLLIVGIELTTNFFTYDDPFIRFFTTKPRETWGLIEKDVIHIFAYLPLLISKRGGEGTVFLFLIGIVGFTICIVKKQKTHVILFFWTALIYCFFTFLGLLPVIFSWEDKVLLRLHQFRYWIPIFPPLIITGVSVLEQSIMKILKMVRVRQNFTQSTATALLILLLFFSSLLGINGVKNNSSLIRNGNDHYLELREFLKENNDPQEVIWVVRNMKIGYDRVLPIYTHDFWGRELWSGSLKYLNTSGQFIKANEITSGTIIIDRYFFNPDFNRIPDYLAHPPDAWQLVFESENNQIALYSVN